MLSLSAGAPCTLLTMFCGQDVCSDVPDTGEQPHQEPEGDSEEGTSAAGSSAGRVCAGVFVVEATPDTEVDVEASTAQEDEDDDGYGGEMITDTRPLRARAHRPRQAVTIRREQACQWSLSPPCTPQLTN